MPFDEADSLTEQSRVIVKIAEAGIAAMAKQSADFASGMIVIDGKEFKSRIMFRFFTDVTYTALRL